jgi:hypothetical protein
VKTRLIGFLLASVLAAGARALPAWAEPAPQQAIALHLACEDGSAFDIVVLSDHSLAAFAESIDGIAILKGIDWDFDGTLDLLFGAQGISPDDLVVCVASDAGGSLPPFVAYVMFTPRGPVMFDRPDGGDLDG